MTTLMAVLAEAWSEIRVHKLRVILSLLGVFLAVFGMTSIAAASNIGRQLVTESAERASGRPATLMVAAYPFAALPDNERIESALREVVERYDIEYSSMYMESQVVANFPTQSEWAAIRSVDPDYGAMHRLLLQQGRWFTEADTDRFAPGLVVSQSFAARLGGFDPTDPPTVRLGGESPVTATVIGIAEEEDYGYPFAYVLSALANRWAIGGDSSFGATPTLQMWVPPDQVAEISAAVQGDLRASLPGHDVYAERFDQGEEAEEVYSALDNGGRAVGYFALLLGGIGVLNVGLVVVRQRIREIGVRRSFGATSNRVFTTILLESVCATAVAGALAIGCAVALVLNLPYEQILDVPIEDLPPFPLAAAIEGFIAATSVGALAGIIPAVMAVRAKVIDAIRY
ncbi:MAG: ABC transporter permease [Actinomycetota bacterium]|nr:ABC transporter permease [Actinomycetota bacterium]